LKNQKEKNRALLQQIEHIIIPLLFKNYYTKHCVHWCIIHW